MRHFRPILEELERRETPARLLAVSPEAKAILEDVDNLYSMPTVEMQELLETLDIPKQDFCYVVERGVLDGNIWDGPIDEDGNPQSQNALIYLFRSVGSPPEGYDIENLDPPQMWYFGAWIEGCGATQQVYAEFAASASCQLFQLTIEVADDGKFLVDGSTLDMLSNTQLGDAFHACVLTDGLEADLGTYSTEGEVFDEELGEMVGDNVLTLKLAVATEGGWMVHTLQSGLDEWNLHGSWSLTNSTLQESLTPDILELKVR